MAGLMTPPRGSPVARPDRSDTGRDPSLGSSPTDATNPRSAGSRGRAEVTPMPSVPTASDDQLVAQTRDGDRTAFAELLRRHDARMRGLAYRLLLDRHAMEDALQEAYVKAYRALDRFAAGSDFGTWLYRITYNACIDELRRRRRTPVAVEVAEEPVSSQPGPERIVTEGDTVRRALAELPVEQRLTVVLVDGEGFDHREAARVLGVAPGTVASRLHRARAALRRIIGEATA